DHGHSAARGRENPQARRCRWAEGLGCVDRLDPAFALPGARRERAQVDLAAAVVLVGNPADVGATGRVDGDVVAAERHVVVEQDRLAGEAWLSRGTSRYCRACSGDPGAGTGGVMAADGCRGD